MRAIEEYEAENRKPAVVPSPLPSFPKAWLGSTVYAVVLLAFYAASWDRPLDLPWLSAGSAQAGLILQGEWWRVLTALCLHGGAVHLLGNMAVGGLLGFLAGRRFGSGPAWLGIVLSGAVGNALNAAIQPASHDSIGASTAVFGALGILAAHAWRGTAGRRPRAVERWAPLVSGVVLLSMFGLGGERTDVVAHITGFGSGVLAGWGFASLSPSSLARTRVQAACGLAALALPLLAWVVAFAQM